VGINEEQRAHKQLYWRFKQQEALRSGRWKMLRDNRDAPARLFDLTSDPAELRDLSADYPEEARKLVEQMNLIRDRSE
jgi:arylsulfatase A-like enzyme